MSSSKSNTNVRRLVGLFFFFGVGRAASQKEVRRLLDCTDCGIKSARCMPCVGIPVVDGQ